MKMEKTNEYFFFFIMDSVTIYVHRDTFWAVCNLVHKHLHYEIRSNIYSMNNQYKTYSFTFALKRSKTTPVFCKWNQTR